MVSGGEQESPNKGGKLRFFCVNMCYICVSDHHIDGLITCFTNNYRQ